eukprot:TRINITY_DN2495_c0_g1_i1.p4 TRINITY_DN2495_c0_g1~~TRINITY_DN2495_c0_g1_i1.p4  ORF type:complete len:113 (-),score=37.33 TRINITY_DN2495_c0_g1_i1:236-574(-)
MEWLRVEEPALAARVEDPELPHRRTAVRGELYALWEELASAQESMDYQGTERLLRKFFKVKGFRQAATDMQSELVFVFDDFATDSGMLSKPKLMELVDRSGTFCKYFDGRAT